MMRLFTASLALMFFCTHVWAVVLHPDESRVFVKAQAFRLGSETVVDTSDWVQKHGSALREVSDRVRALVGSPTCLSLVRLGFILDGKPLFYELPYFYSSKTKLHKRSDDTPLRPEDLTSILADERVNGTSFENYAPIVKETYEGYAFKPLAQLSKAPFKALLKNLYETLPPKRQQARFQELEKDRMGFFFHSEQSVILDIFYKNEELLEKLTRRLDGSKGKVTSLFLNVMGTFDPCCRCGDALRQVSASHHKEFLEALKKKLPETLLIQDDAPFVVTYHGLTCYADPEPHAGVPNPLRPKESDIEPPYDASPLLALMCLVPKIACTFLPC